ncbi:hypothetical protein [Leptospira santarosai]|nr:hypothetical protein [Leptospira santarosai]EMM77189.1 hypothetical protein LEP1GSC040_2652 [Leptospira santarosai str. 2000030832]MDI7199895.1 hypothetical protein [Leptospira santarosai]MDI7213298.1 hypothetical protein [Leptospira santarosai]MDI7223758.1 hypothetical protein [Leptospira santarosai]
MSDWFVLIHTVRVFDFTGPDSMSSYIPDLQEDFIRFLRFVALFEVCK